MNITTILVFVLVVVPASLGMVWAHLAMAQVEDDLRAFSGFDGLNFNRL